MEIQYKMKMQNAKCKMRNEDKPPYRIPTFNIQHSAFIILFLALFIYPSLRLDAADNIDLFYHPYTVEPDTSKMVYPIPISTGNPFLDLNNKSPFYLSDPDNFETEIIYDPLTGQYTFKRRIGQFYYDSPSTLTQSEFFEYKNRKGIQEYWKERRS